MAEVKKEKETKKTTKKKETVSETKKETKKKVTKLEEKEEKVTKTRKTTKKEKVILDKVDQRRYSSLCKAVKILAKIGRICLMICIPFIFLTMILIPILFSKVEIEPNMINFQGTSIIFEYDTITVKIGDNIHVMDTEPEVIEDITYYLNNYSNGKITFLIEVSLLLLGVFIVFEIYVLCNIENLFINLINNKEPFTKENTDIILLTAKYLLASKITLLCMSIFSLFKNDTGIISVIEILIAFTLYYIFKYGTAIQTKKDTKIIE